MSRNRNVAAESLPPEPSPHRLSSLHTPPSHTANPWPPNFLAEKWAFVSPAFSARAGGHSKLTGWSSSAAPGPLWTMYCERSCSNSGEEERIVAPIHARIHLRPCSVGRCSSCRRLRGGCGSMSDMRLSLHTVSRPTREAGALPPSLAGGHMVVVSVPLGAVGSQSHVLRQVPVRCSNPCPTLPA